MIGEKNLVIFDLDHTLLKGDSDYCWGEFLVQKGMVNKTTYKLANKKFYQDYKNGSLDIKEFSEFVFAVLKKYPLDVLIKSKQEYINKIIKPLITTEALDLVQKHRINGDILLIITATNSFITRDIATLFKIKDLIATEPEFKNNKFTGKLDGVASFGNGKIVRLIEWLKKNKIQYDKSCFYSDSINDLPLLEWVDIPIATNPDNKLKKHALKHNWKIIKTHD
jgi:HAD superfamily hydrolase (TIGR01490 family)